MKHGITWLSLCAVLAGCTAEITTPRQSSPEPQPTVEPGSSWQLPPCDRSQTRVAPLGTQLVRLTHRQYDNTVRDLLGVDAAVSIGFQKDPTFQGFDNNAAGLFVADRLGRDYRRSAEELAAAVASDPSKLARVRAGCDTAECFVRTFGRLAWRRALSASEETALAALFAKGKDVIEGTHDDFAKGVQLVVEATLQSPHFLYRVETGAAGPLSPHQVAARLSYLLWNSTPPQELLDLAETGQLATAEQVKAQARAMLLDPRARGVVDGFHHQWLDLDHYEDLSRDESLYPLFTAEVPALLQEETRRFVRDVVLDAPAPFSSLFTASHTFVPRQLAALYGVGGDFVENRWDRVELDPAQRKGLLTQLGFLASHAYMRTDSPIHRGVFVIRKILCQQIPNPPGDIDTNLPPLSGTIKTTRQQVAAHTSPAGCTGCHTRINGVGFGFSSYDAVGQYRTTENGESVDSTGEILLDGKKQAFSSAVELAELVGASAEARSCYATNWVRYALQRTDAPEDACAVEDLRKQLGRGDVSVKDAIVELVGSRPFLERAEEVTP